MSEKKQNIDRRDFFKFLGGGLAAASLASCKPKVESITGIHQVGEPTGTIDYRVSKTHGDKISLLGFGGMRWPKLDHKLPNGNMIDQEVMNELFDKAIEYGVNYFDTAPMYMQGWSERVMGAALKRHPREKYFVATKMSNMSPALQSAEKSKEIFYNSLKNLQVDYIDFYLLHNVGNGGYDNFKARFLDNGILDFLIEQRKAGKIRNLGFSYHGDIRAFDYLLSRHEEIVWDFAMIQVNYKDWLYADETSPQNTDGVYLYNELAKRDIDVIIMEPLLGGRLNKQPVHLANKMHQMRPDKSLAWWAFRYAGSFDKVITVLSGVSYLEHLQENVQTYSPLEPITPEEDKMLMQVAEMMVDYPLVECTACQYCMPCPYGIDIPEIFTHYNKCVCDDHFPQSKQDANYREARRAFLVGYDRAVEKLRQADHCIGCKKCVVHCPQKVNIPKEMQRVAEYVEKLKRENL